MLSGLARFLLLAVAIVVVVEGVQFAVEGSDYFLYRFFAPRQEAVRRQVFEESKSYNDGVAQDLWGMKLQYERADVSGKASLRSLILHRTAAYDSSRLPPDLQDFVTRLHREELGN